MAAYAALVSLINTVDHIQNHYLLLISFHKEQIEYLRDKLRFLLEDSIETGFNGLLSKEEAQVLETQIASAAYAAEDVIESHMVKTRIHDQFISLLDLKKVIKNMDSIAKMVTKVKERNGRKSICSIPLLCGLDKVTAARMDSANEKNIRYSIPATSSSRSLTTENNDVVGIEDELIQLMDALVGGQSSRQIISIVGMGGIGKTTLARNVYEDPLISHHFDIRAWVTVSQKYSASEILLELVSCLRRSTDRKDQGDLGEHLYKSLSGRRYLIVLDDIWSISAWNRISRFLPNDTSGSRIVVTTRLSDVAVHFGSSCRALSFLDEDKSWKLFSRKAFAEQGCPPELEGIGKKIVRKCKGLPLAIVVIGRLLAKSDKTLDNFENFERDISSILNSGEEEHCLDILSLSYRHLPVHLKPCFLYIGVFEEDHEIRLSRLIKLWVAEGFLKPSESQSLEEIAGGYLKDLVDRNLILVHKWGVSGKIKTCKIHDLLRDLCLREAKKEKFFRVTSVVDIPREIERERRIVCRGDLPRGFTALSSTSLARSLVWEWVPLRSKCRLLRVLQVVGTDSQEAILEQHVNLRYIAYEFDTFSTARLPPSISLLWNLQTMIFRRVYSDHMVAPPEIWGLRQLRHLEFDGLCLPPPPPPLSEGEGGDDVVLRNLQTLLTVVNFELSDEVCYRIQNVTNLKIMYDSFATTPEDYSLYNLWGLHKLESLSCFFGKWSNWGFRFPRSLQKLTLQGCRLRWEDLTMIGSLPRLQVLKLKPNSVGGSEWSPVEGGFPGLKLLKILYCGLIRWNADRCHFPVLERVVLVGLDELEEIPPGIGDVATLGVIDLEDCSESAAISAVRIAQEQEGLGNEGLQFRVKFGSKEQLEGFREKVEEEFGSIANSKYSFM